MRIFLIRHGQTTGDVEDRYGGAYDDQLTELGKKQAMQIAEHLKDEGIEKVFTSPLIRAKETASILGQKLHKEIEILPDIQERDQNGILTGMRRAEAREKYPDEVAVVKDYTQTIHGAETYLHFRERVIRALHDLAQKPYQTIAVITHGGPIRVIFREILAKGEITIQDCGYAVIEANNRQYMLLESQGIEII